MSRLIAISSELTTSGRFAAIRVFVLGLLMSAVAACADVGPEAPSDPALGELHLMLAGPRAAMSVCSDREPSLLLALRPPEVECGCDPAAGDGTCAVSPAQDALCGTEAYCDPLLGFQCRGLVHYAALADAPHCDTGFLWNDVAARCESLDGPVGCPTSMACAPGYLCDEAAGGLCIHPSRRCGQGFTWNAATSQCEGNFPSSPCSDATDCPVGAFCDASRGGYCNFECVTDADCDAIDGGFCGCDGRCTSATEFQALGPTVTAAADRPEVLLSGLDDTAPGRLFVSRTSAVGGILTASAGRGHLVACVQDLTSPPSSQGFVSRCHLDLSIARTARIDVLQDSSFAGELSQADAIVAVGTSDGRFRITVPIRREDTNEPAPVTSVPLTGGWFRGTMRLERGLAGDTWVEGQPLAFGSPLLRPRPGDAPLDLDGETISPRDWAVARWSSMPAAATVPVRAYVAVDAAGGVTLRVFDTFGLLLADRAVDVFFPNALAPAPTARPAAMAFAADGDELGAPRLFDHPLSEHTAREGRVQLQPLPDRHEAFPTLGWNPTTRTLDGGFRALARGASTRPFNARVFVEGDVEADASDWAFDAELAFSFSLEQDPDASDPPEAVPDRSSRALNRVAVPEWRSNGAPNILNLFDPLGRDLRRSEWMRAGSAALRFDRLPEDVLGPAILGEGAEATVWPCLTDLERVDPAHYYSAEPDLLSVACENNPLLLVPPHLGCDSIDFAGELRAPCTARFVESGLWPLAFQGAPPFNAQQRCLSTYVVARSEIAAQHSTTLNGTWPPPEYMLVSADATSASAHLEFGENYSAPVNVFDGYQPGALQLVLERRKARTCALRIGTYSERALKAVPGSEPTVQTLALQPLKATSVEYRASELESHSGEILGAASTDDKADPLYGKGAPFLTFPWELEAPGTVSKEQLVAACIRDLEREPPWVDDNPRAPDAEGLEWVDEWRDLFQTEGCVDLGRFHIELEWLARGAVAESLIEDRADFGDLKTSSTLPRPTPVASGLLVRRLVQWMNVHALLARSGVDSVLRDRIAEDGGTQTDRRRLLELMRQGFNVFYQPGVWGGLKAMPNEILKDFDYRRFVVTPAAHRRWLAGRPDAEELATDFGTHPSIVMAEALTTYLELADAHLKSVEPGLYEDCVQGAFSPGDIDFVGDATRHTHFLWSLMAKMMLDSEMALTAPNTTTEDQQRLAAWQKRFGVASDALAHAMTKLEDRVGRVLECRNPLGIAEDDLPLYFVDPAGVNARFFAASDYLLEQMAGPAIERADAMLARARSALMSQRDAEVRQTLNTFDHERRLEGIETSYGQQVNDLCGFGVPSQYAMQRYFDGGFTPQDCWFKDEQCKMEFHGFAADTADELAEENGCSLAQGAGVEMFQRMTKFCVLARENDEWHQGYANGPDNALRLWGTSPRLAAHLDSTLGVNMSEWRAFMDEHLVLRTGISRDVGRLAEAMGRVHRWPNPCDDTYCFVSGDGVSPEEQSCALFTGDQLDKWEESVLAAYAAEPGSSACASDAKECKKVGSPGAYLFAKHGMACFEALKDSPFPPLDVDAERMSQAFVRSLAEADCLRGALGAHRQRVLADARAIGNLARTVGDAEAKYLSREALCAARIVDPIRRHEADVALAAYIRAQRSIGGVFGWFTRAVNLAMKIAANPMSAAQEASEVFSFLWGAVGGAINANSRGNIRNAKELNSALNTAYDSEIISLGCAVEAQELLSDFENHVAAFDEQVRQFAMSLQALREKELVLERLQREYKVEMARETERRIPDVRHHYWFDESARAFERDMEWARRLVFLGLRALEYEAQQSFPYRAELLRATTPQHLADVVLEMKREHATRAINGNRPEEKTVVVSLRDDGLLRRDAFTKPDGTAIPPGARTDTAYESFGRMLTDPNNAYYDDEGNYVGQALSFDLRPFGALRFRCAERLWTVSASIEGDLLGAGAPRLPLFVLKQNTFSSQWCDGRGPARDGTALTQFQQASLKPATNLFRDANAASAGDTDPFSWSYVDAWLNVPRRDFHRDDYALGSSNEFAGRALYGRYVVLVPWYGLQEHGVDLKRVEDIVLRFDYVSVANGEPGTGPASPGYEPGTDVAESLTATGLVGGVRLRWKNPTAFDFGATMVVRNELGIPADAADGDVVYLGTRSEFVDVAASPGQLYHYRVFSEVGGAWTDGPWDDATAVEAWTGTATAVVTNVGGPGGTLLTWTPGQNDAFDQVRIARAMDVVVEGEIQLGVFTPWREAFASATAGSEFDTYEGDPGGLRARFRYMIEVRVPGDRSVSGQASWVVVSDTLRGTNPNGTGPCGYMFGWESVRLLGGVRLAHQKYCGVTFPGYLGYRVIRSDDDPPSSLADGVDEGVIQTATAIGGLRSVEHHFLLVLEGDGLVIDPASGPPLVARTSNKPFAEGHFHAWGVEARSGLHGVDLSWNYPTNEIPPSSITGWRVERRTVSTGGAFTWGTVASPAPRSNWYDLPVPSNANMREYRLWASVSGDLTVDGMTVEVLSPSTVMGVRPLSNSLTTRGLVNASELTLPPWTYPAATSFQVRRSFSGQPLTPSSGALAGHFAPGATVIDNGIANGFVWYTAFPTIAGITWDSGYTPPMTYEVVLSWPVADGLAATPSPATVGNTSTTFDISWNGCVGPQAAPSTQTLYRYPESFGVGGDWLLTGAGTTAWNLNGIVRRMLIEGECLVNGTHLASGVSTTSPHTARRLSAFVNFEVTGVDVGNELFVADPAYPVAYAWTHAQGGGHFEAGSTYSLAMLNGTFNNKYIAHLGTFDFTGMTTASFQADFYRWNISGSGSPSVAIQVKTASGNWITAQNLTTANLGLNVWTRVNVSLGVYTGDVLEIRLLGNQSGLSAIAVDGIRITGAGSQ